MHILLTGISCVGKTTIGKKMSKKLDINFYDLDNEIEKYFKTSIERLQNRFLTMHSFRNEASKALANLLTRTKRSNNIIALPPSGLMGGYFRVIKKYKHISIFIYDKPENIVKRLRFYDIDSNPIEKVVNKKEEKLYLREIKKDYTYFRPSHKKANIQVDITNLKITQAAQKIIESLNDYF